ncbi:MAG: GGDEF domain-containing protein, partial [Candidatus Rokubacteria bacterium]|nr:GGDEF domain-containing protein [Candidatus Rokubacteria bacterium]
MHAWEHGVSNVLHLVRLDSIKSKILVFMLLATLIPSLTLGWRSYVQNRRAVTERISEGLRNLTDDTARETGLWLKERLYELRVFASSYEVTENLEKLISAPGGAARAGEAPRRLTDYLRSVRAKFRDYEELMVVGTDGRARFTSADQADEPRLPPDWLKQAAGDNVIVGETYWDDTRKKGLMAVAVPVKTLGGRFLGALVAKLNFVAVEEFVKGPGLGQTSQIYLVRQDGTLIVGSRAPTSGFLQARLPEKSAQALFQQQTTSLEYDNYEGHPVIGALKRVPQLGWGAVAEIGRKEAYAQTLRIRNVTLFTVAGLVVGIGIVAYFLGLTIVRPLNRLTAGASEVAAGDLNVDLPVVVRGEVGHMTRVFNDMVAHLRRGRQELAAINATLSQKNQELQELSITDGLTGLYNRKHLMETLATEIGRAGRFKHPFAVLMVDIDRFKQYNDSHGHLAGDQLLSRIAALFKETTR